MCSTNTRNKITAKILEISGLLGKLDTNSVKEIEQIINDIRAKLVNSDESTVYVEGVAVDFADTETALNFLRGL